MSFENPEVLHSIEKQIEFRNQLFELATKIKENKKEKFAQKNENLKKFVSRSGIKDMTHFDPPRPMPINPKKIFVRGIEPQKCFVFKSAMLPLKLSFYYQNAEEPIVKKKE